MLKRIRIHPQCPLHYSSKKCGQSDANTDIASDDLKTQVTVFLGSYRACKWNHGESPCKTVSGRFREDCQKSDREGKAADQAQHCRHNQGEWCQDLQGSVQRPAWENWLRVGASDKPWSLRWSMTSLLRPWGFAWPIRLNRRALSPGSSHLWANSSGSHSVPDSVVAPSPNHTPLI